MRDILNKLQSISESNIINEQQHGINLPDNSYVDMFDIHILSFKPVDKNKTIFMGFMPKDGSVAMKTGWVPYEYVDRLSELENQYGKLSDLMFGGVGTVSMSLKSYNDLDDRNKVLGVIEARFKTPDNVYYQYPQVRVHQNFDLSNTQNVVRLIKSLFSGNGTNLDVLTHIKLELDDPSLDSVQSKVKIINYSPNQNYSTRQSKSASNSTTNKKSTTLSSEVAFERGIELAQNNTYEDDDEALKLFTIAAKDPKFAGSANYAIGLLYYNQEDYVTCMKYWKKSGTVDAAKGLGILYSQGQGVPENNKMAAKYYIKAALADDGDSALNLGNMYADDRLGFNPYKAYAFYKMAEENGVDEAGEYAQELYDQFQELLDDDDLMNSIWQEIYAGKI